MYPTTPQESSTFAPAGATTLRVYLRQSIGEDRNTHGIEAQRGICERFARTLDPSGAMWLKRVEYVDIGYSRDDLTRPEYIRLIKETAKTDTVLIWERSRLGVDLDYAVAVRELIERHGAVVRVASTGETIDFGGDFGSVIETMHGAASGAELRRIRGRTRDKLRERVQKGFVGGALPYGLRSVPVNPSDPSSFKQGEIVPAEAEIVIRMATLYADGAGWERIAKTLTADNVPCPGGATEWTRAHVWDVLIKNQRTYRGEYVYGVRGGKGGKIPPIVVHHPEWKIGSNELWARVDAAHAARTRDMRGQIANAAKHALSGPVRCGSCGGSLATNSVGGRYGSKALVYLCSRAKRSGGRKCNARYRIPASAIEGAILSALGSWFDLTEKAIAEAAAEVEARIAATEAPDVDAIDRQLEAALLPRPSNEGKVGLVETGYVMEGRGTPIVV
jgi:DNA invertase Pin-like site-specific DNA recombinase